MAPRAGTKNLTAKPTAFVLRFPKDVPASCSRGVFVIQCTPMKTGAETWRPVGAIILAAGGSVRMGRPKQLLPIGGQSMVRVEGARGQVGGVK